MTIALESRPATEADLEFLYALHRAALSEYVEKTWGWDEEWQANRFRDWVDLSTRRIVMHRGAPIGCVALRDHDDHLFLEYMAFLPDFQRRGLGTREVETILERARELGKPVRLNVLRVNPARRFYERLGFRVVGEDEHRYHMEAPPRDTAT